MFTATIQSGCKCYGQTLVAASSQAQLIDEVKAKVTFWQRWRLLRLAITGLLFAVLAFCTIAHLAVGSLFVPIVVAVTAVSYMTLCTRLPCAYNIVHLTKVSVRSSQAWRRQLRREEIELGRQQAPDNNSQWLTIINRQLP